MWEHKSIAFQEGISLSWLCDKSNLSLEQRHAIAFVGTDISPFFSSLSTLALAEAKATLWCCMGEEARDWSTTPKLFSVFVSVWSTGNSFRVISSGGTFGFCLNWGLARWGKRGYLGLKKFSSFGFGQRQDRPFRRTGEISLFYLWNVLLVVWLICCGVDLKEKCVTLYIFTKLWFWFYKLGTLWKHQKKTSNTIWGNIS